MGFEPGTLFFASGVSAFALAITMLGVWLQNRLDRFMIGWMLGMVMLGMGALLYASFPLENKPVTALSFSLEIIGFVAVYVAARLFTGRPVSLGKCVMAGGAAIGAVVIPILAGPNGIGVMLINLIAAVCLFLCAFEYWRAFEESPFAILGITGLYALAGLTFVACGLVLLIDGQWVLLKHPDGVAEQINAIAAIAGITGIGALSLALNQMRAARRHRIEAQTDMLTGLMNRRALFSNFTANRLAPGDAVVVFDLDRFKSINDRYGHGAGDKTLKEFAKQLRMYARPGDVAARLGGEEFVLVMRQVTVAQATDAAERIRREFASTPLKFGDTAVTVTVSAGIAFAGSEIESFDDVMHRADMALYRAKNNGRDRVLTELQVVA
jgi:diguanylate cyclase (GGDEF) domain